MESRLRDISLLSDLFDARRDRVFRERELPLLLSSETFNFQICFRVPFRRMDRSKEVLVAHVFPNLLKTKQRRGYELLLRTRCV